MNWAHHGFTPLELEFQNAGQSVQSNFQHQYSSSFPSTFVDLKEQRKTDEDFIKSFIEKQDRKIESKSNVINISNARNILLEIICEKKKLEKAVLDLDVNDENFDSKWNLLVTELNGINEQIVKFDSDFEKNSLMRALKRRTKKRITIRKTKEKLKELKKEQQERIQEKHENIGKLLNDRSEEVEAIKREAALKRQADIVLHEVQKKKYEAKKMLNLLGALAKLRELRGKEEEKLGGYCSKQLMETFNKVMTRFQQLWEKQLEVYKLEEKGLKIMLAESTLQHKKESKIDTNILQWEEVLFGDLSNSEMAKFLTLAESDIQTLIQVRQDWDQFLKTDTAVMASRIPLGWVLPPETHDEHWKAFARSISL